MTSYGPVRHLPVKEMRRVLVLAKALAYAIETIRSLPHEWQEYSDMKDMEILLDELGHPWKQLAIDSAKSHIKGAKDDQGSDD